MTRIWGGYDPSLHVTVIYVNVRDNIWTPFTANTQTGTACSPWFVDLQECGGGAEPDTDVRRNRSILKVTLPSRRPPDVPVDKKPHHVTVHFTAPHADRYVSEEVSICFVSGITRDSIDGALSNGGW